MARILSTAQKKQIFTQLPAVVTIDEKTINASKIYPNQEITNYPVISLNFANDGVQYVKDVADGVLYYQSILTIHVQTKNDDKSGATIAESFCNEIISEIESWVTPLSGDVRIFDPESDIKSIQNRGYSETVYDYVLSVNLYHS